MGAIIGIVASLICHGEAKIVQSFRILKHTAIRFDAKRTAQITRGRPGIPSAPDRHIVRESNIFELESVLV